jgi:hypothetical protein
MPPNDTPRTPKTSPPSNGLRELQSFAWCLGALLTLGPIWLLAFLASILLDPLARAAGRVRAWTARTLSRVLGGSAPRS